jgi:hypothetical protein
MVIKAILWDFGDTLADERWMQAPLHGVRGWPEACRAFGATSLADEWNIGAITSRDVAEDFACKLDTSANAIHDHMEACCRDLSFFPRVIELVEDCTLPQAIVTINCDIFSSIVVPHYQLHSRFPVIVTSWEERSLSKSTLCDVAIARLGLSLERSECLLIDNKQENVADWIARGGAAYHFQGEEELRSDLDHVLG